MNKNKIVCMLGCFMLCVSALFISGCDADPALVLSSIETVSEYGAYFGMKSAKFDDKKAKIGEEGVRSILMFLEADSLTELVDLDSAMQNLDDDIAALIRPLLTKIDGKYVDLKKKIPEEKLPYIIAVFRGAFKGIENYRKTLEDKSDSSVASVSKYEEELTKKYNEAKKNLE